jgi:anaerobic magnesium-protoporphyrin IX monomethyl ester cyclase
MNIVLVQPPFRYFPGSKPKFDYTRPPLGLAYVAGYLREKLRGRVTVRILDRISCCDDPATIAREILGHHPQVVGFSVVTGTVGVVQDIAASIRQARPDVKIVAGGPHVTVRPGDLDSQVDAAVVREGEETMAELMTSWQEGRGIEDIPGLWVPGAPERFRERPLIEDLDVLPLPARDLLPTEAYYHTYPYRVSRDHPNFTTMFTTRGCAFDCAFCGNRRLWRSRVRTFGIERIRRELDEMTSLHRVGLVFFDDDAFTMSRQRVGELCELIRTRYPFLRWVVHARVDQIDREVLTEMKRSGLVEIQFGIESGDPEMLKAMRKGIKPEQSVKALRLCRELGIRTWGTFVLGCLGETRESLRRTLDFAKRANPSYASFITLLPFPGTRMFDELDARGYLLTKNWNHYSWYSSPVFRTPDLSEDELLQWQRRANLEFYLRPSKVAMLARDVLAAGSLRELTRDLHAWWSLVAK